METRHGFFCAGENVAAAAAAVESYRWGYYPENRARQMA